MSSNVGESESHASLVPKNLSLRARGIAPRPDYIITPAAGSLVGDIPSLRDDLDRTNALADQMLTKYGVRRPS